MSIRTDVAIVGAGVAGLAAARRLHEYGRECLVLEARKRIGGRVYTVDAPDGTPIELGGEFIHGPASVTRELLREAGDHAVDHPSQMFELRDGTLQPACDMWDSATQLLERVDRRGGDRSVEEFLKALARSGAAQRDVQAAGLLVEGFDAAILSDASAIAVADEWASSVNSSASRPAASYQKLVHALSAPVADRVMLDARVTTITRTADGVAIVFERYGEIDEVIAKAAIVTVSIGVLRSRSIAFDPPLPQGVQQAINCIAEGPVYKVVLHFASPFWELLEDGRFAGASFFQAPDGDMRTVWTQLPKRAPTLTAWAGGGAALRLHAKGIDPVAAAMHTVQQLFPAASVPEQLRAAYFHDWQADAFARGAYSYVLVGALDARKTLAKGVDDRLVLAGEATSEDQSGTVAGAIESGYNAAARVNRA